MHRNSTDSDHDLLVSELRLLSPGKAPINEDEIRNAFKIERFKTGMHFVREGDVPNSIGFITKGLMKYYYIDRDGNEWIKHFSAEKEFVASYASFLHQTPSLYNIEAMTETTVLSIDFKTYVDNISKSMTWCSIARKYTEMIYYEKERREASFLMEDGSERYSHFIIEYKHLLSRISIKDIASFLGLTTVSLSRIRNNKQGRINKC
jgi:CRP-like cAMP-binding protein